MIPSKLPWMKFYPADWRSDACLRVCSLAARGLWMEMLALMHEASGWLVMNDKPITEKQLSALSGASLAEVTGLLSELKGAGVFSIDDDGTIYSRRMRRDLEKAAQDKANGKRGGSPIFKAPDKPTDNGGDNPPHKAQKLEARDQKLDHSPSEARDARDGRLEVECRKLAGSLPVIVDPNFSDILQLLDDEPNLTEADVLAAMGAIVSTRHRLEFWKKLTVWVRRAAKDRLAAAMGPANYARAGPAANGTHSSNFNGSRPNGTSKPTPSDFLREQIARRASLGFSEGAGDQELSAGRSDEPGDAAPRLLSEAGLRRP